MTQLDALGRRNNMLEMTEADRERCVCDHIRKWHHERGCSRCDAGPYGNCRGFEEPTMTERAEVGRPALADVCQLCYEQNDTIPPGAHWDGGYEWDGPPTYRYFEKCPWGVSS